MRQNITKYFIFIISIFVTLFLLSGCDVVGNEFLKEHMKSEEKVDKVLVEEELLNETEEEVGHESIEDEKYGTLSWEGGSYEGELSEGKPHGKGAWSHPDGDEFVGEWKDGNKLSGHGTYTWQNGDKYVGEYKDGKRHGQGKMISANGNVYDGEWKDGEMHGQGTYTSQSGTKYVGEVKNGIPHGHGILTNQDGLQYAGGFVDGEFHGHGKIIWPSGREYIGEFKDGKRHGQGTLIEASGAKYIGGWKDDEFDGKAVAIAPDGRRMNVEYRDGNLIDSSTPKESATKSPSLKTVSISYWGGTYKGEVMNGIPHGQGTLTWPSGTYFTGRWERGQFLGNGAGSR